MDGIFVLTAIAAVASVIGAIFATWRWDYARKAFKIQRFQYKIQKIMLEESRKYWSGWISRSEDIAISFKKELNKMFLANMIDTEGCIVINRSKRKDYEKTGLTSLSPTVDFSNSSKEIVDKFKKLSKVEGKIEKFKGTNKPMYRFRINKHEEILRLLLPIHEYLIVKRKQAILMIGFCRLRIKNRRKHYNDRERELANAIIQLNRKNRNVKCLALF